MRRINPRIVWVTCAAIALAAASSLAVVDLASKEPTAFYEPDASQVSEAGKAAITRALVLFASCFAGIFTVGSALAFGAIKLAGLDTERRRRPERRPVRILVEVESDRGPYAAHSENVSISGLFIATDQAHPMGERLKLQFQLPTENKPLTVEAEVRWVRRSAAGQGEAPTGMGLLFVDPSFALSAAVRRFLA